VVCKEEWYGSLGEYIKVQNGYALKAKTLRKMDMQEL
jgi:hypothetical protein